MSLSDQLLRAQRALAKERKARKALEGEVAELRERTATAEQSASMQHVAMMKQDHVHAEHIAALTTKVDEHIARINRMVDAWDKILVKAQA